MVYNAIFNSISVLSQRPAHLSLLSWSSFNQYSRTIFFSSHWLRSHITIVETTDSDERGMNPVAMTIINSRKKYWPSLGSNQRPPVLRSATLPTELHVWGSACISSLMKIVNLIYQHFLITSSSWAQFLELQSSEITGNTDCTDGFKSVFYQEHICWLVGCIWV